MSRAVGITAILACFATITGFIGIVQAAPQAETLVPGQSALIVEKTRVLCPQQSAEDAGSTIWSNFPVQGWWDRTQGYLVLDWGLLDLPPTGMPDEVVDGFSFAYATNNMDPAGDDIALFYFDDCTGWGNLGVQVAAFLFTGLPNGYGLPSLPPGNAWVWTISTDLAGTGYEFLLNRQFGQLMDCRSPTMGSTIPALGSPHLMSTGLLDLYSQAGVYCGTWLSPTGGNMAKELYGPRAPAGGMTYYGIGAQGNQAALYTSGDWAAGQDVHFMLRKYGMTQPSWLLASLQQANRFIPQLDLTILVGPLVGGTPRMMSPNNYGDFDFLDITIPNVAGSMRIYMQGAITNLTPIAPADCSNGVYSN
jgi:hypothetical protein